MIIENISALKVQKLSQDQFDNARENNTLDNNSIYLTPTVVKDYALKSDLKEKADLIDGKIPLEQLPDGIGGGNLTFDEEPTEGSSNLVNSGSLYNIIGNVNLVIDSIDALIGGET